MDAHKCSFEMEERDCSQHAESLANIQIPKTLPAISDSHRVTMRGCAKQDFSYQVYNEAERGWDTVTEIKESIYPEGCFFSAGQTHGLREGGDKGEHARDFFGQGQPIK